MLHPFMSRNFIGPTPVKQLILFSEREPVCVNPCSIDAAKSSVQILLIVLCSLDQGHVWELGDFLCAD